MLKFLLILIIILYLLYKIGSFFFKIGAASQQFRTFDQHKKGSGENVSGKQAKKGSKFNGGEYIDYEEVKK